MVYVAFKIEPADCARAFVCAPDRKGPWPACAYRSMGKDHTEGDPEKREMHKSPEAMRDGMGQYALLFFSAKKAMLPSL